MWKNYTKDKNWIYFNAGWYEWSLISKDFKNFKTLNDYYAIDSENIYINWKESNWWDVKTFEVLSDWYAKDKNYFFYKNDVNAINHMNPSNNNVNNFSVLKYWYAKDNNNFYYKWETIHQFLNNDEEKIYDEDFLTDWFYIYRRNSNNNFIRFKINDIETLEILNYFYIKDKTWIYSDNQDSYKFENKWLYVEDNFELCWKIDIKTFILLEDNLNWIYLSNNWKDKKDYYKWCSKTKISKINKYRTVIWINEDLKFNIKNLWFEIYKKYWNIEYLYNQLDDFIYFSFEKNKIKLNLKLEDVSFTTRNYILWKNNWYYKWKEIKWIDVKSFEILEDWYSKDKNLVYLNWNIQKELDTNTFKNKWIYIENKNNKLYNAPAIRINKNIHKEKKEDKKLIDLRFWYYKDEKNVYTDSYGDGLKGVDFWRNSPDIKTFEILDDNFAKDKNNVYQKVDPCDNNGNEYWNFISLWTNLKAFKIEWIFFKNDKEIYNEYVDIVKNVDAKTFEFKNWVYKDKNYIYDYYRESWTQECTRNLWWTWFNKELLFIVNWADYKTYKKIKDFSYWNRWQYVETSLNKDKNYYFLSWKKIKWTNSKEKLLDLGLWYYFNNWNIYNLGFKNEIIRKNFDKKNLKNLIITSDFACWLWNIWKDIFFSEKEYLKYKKKFSCEY